MLAAVSKNFEWLNSLILQVPNSEIVNAVVLYVMPVRCWRNWLGWCKTYIGASSTGIQVISQFSDQEKWRGLMVCWILMVFCLVGRRAEVAKLWSQLWRKHRLSRFTRRAAVVWWSLPVGICRSDTRRQLQSIWRFGNQWVFSMFLTWANSQ